MPLRSAHGGHLILPGPLVIPNQRWSGNWRARDAEVTQSDSGGSTLYLGVVQDNEWEFSAARDDAAFPEAVGLSPGAIIPLLFFKLGSPVGAAARADRLANTLVTEVNPVNDNSNDVVRVTVRGKGGFLTPNQVPPS